MFKVQKSHGFAYSDCCPCTENKGRIKKFMQTGNTSYIYNNDLDKACFQHDMSYGKYKDLTKITQSDKGLRDKSFKIASNPKYDAYERRLVLEKSASLADKFAKGSGINSILNKQLADELHRPIIRKFRRRKVNSSFKDNILGADLVDMQLISNCNNRISFLLFVINIFSEYAWVVLLKDEKVVTIVNPIHNISDNLKRKPNKIWVDQGKQCYNNSFKNVFNIQWRKICCCCKIYQNTEK